MSGVPKSVANIGRFFSGRGGERSVGRTLQIRFWNYLPIKKKINIELAFVQITMPTLDENGILHLKFSVYTVQRISLRLSLSPEYTNNNFKNHLLTLLTLLV